MFCIHISMQQQVEISEYKIEVFTSVNTEHL